ncbi:MAG: hypothetical protein H6999_05640 [Hahellaceae bacterium]|nr:hypothetical protein [Hahellaceae bacterium]MCP5169221.1 hypothetical protein [Hahellaceae bacterium]
MSIGRAITFVACWYFSLFGLPAYGTELNQLSYLTEDFPPYNYLDKIVYVLAVNGLYFALSRDISDALVTQLQQGIDQSR